VKDALKSDGLIIIKMYILSREEEDHFQKKNYFLIWIFYKKYNMLKLIQEEHTKKV